MTRTPLRHERGAVIPFVALTLVALITCTAFAVDLGRLRSERRSMQADADVISLDLVRLADGRTTDQILVDPSYATVLARTAAANNIDVTDLDVQYGTFVASRNPQFVPSAGTEVPDAIEVRANGRVDYVFAGVIGASAGETDRTAIAALDSVASLTLGSNTVSLASSEAELLTFLLQSLIPGFPFDFGTDFAGYQGLSSTDVTADDLVEATGDVDASSTIGSPDELMASEVTAQEFGTIYAQALRNDGRLAEADVIDAIAAEADNSTTFQFGDAIGGDVGGPPAAVGANINAFDAFIAALELANSLNFTDACAEVPPANLLVANSSLIACTSIIEAGKTVVGPANDPRTAPPTFRTSQINVTTTSATPIAVNLGIGDLQGAITMPVQFAGGGAEGRLTEIICDRAGGASTTDTLVSPRPVAATIGPSASLASLQLVANVPLLGTVPVAEIAVRADPVDGIDISPSQVNHLVPDQDVGTTEQVPGSGLDLGVMLSDDDIDIDVQILAGALTTNQVIDAVKPLVIGLLDDLLADLASQTVTDFLDSIGLGISESALRLNYVDCGTPRLRG